MGGQEVSPPKRPNSLSRTSPRTLSPRCSPRRRARRLPPKGRPSVLGKGGRGGRGEEGGRGEGGGCGFCAGGGGRGQQARGARRPPPPQGHARGRRRRASAEESSRRRRSHKRQLGRPPRSLKNSGFDLTVFSGSCCLWYMPGVRRGSCCCATSLPRSHRLEVLDHRCAVVAGCIFEGCSPDVARFVDIGLGTDERLHDLQVAIVRNAGEGRLPIIRTTQT